MLTTSHWNCVHRWLFRRNINGPRLTTHTVTESTCRHPQRLSLGVFGNVYPYFLEKSVPIASLALAPDGRCFILSAPRRSKISTQHWFSTLSKAGVLFFKAVTNHKSFMIVNFHNESTSFPIAELALSSFICGSFVGTVLWLWQLTYALEYVEVMPPADRIQWLVASVYTTLNECWNKTFEFEM